MRIYIYNQPMFEIPYPEISFIKLQWKIKVSKDTNFLINTINNRKHIYAHKKIVSCMRDVIAHLLIGLLATNAYAYTKQFFPVWRFVRVHTAHVKHILRTGIRKERLSPCRVCFLWNINILVFGCLKCASRFSQSWHGSFAMN